MGEMRYTATGCDEVERRIAADQALIAYAVEQQIPKDLFVSLILIGGYARGEGGFAHTPTGPQAYNDYDYFVVVNDCSRQQLKRVRDSLSLLAKALEIRVGVEVDFFPLKRSQIAKLPFTLMYAEMQVGHRVIGGDPQILDTMPSMPLSKLPDAEFRRLMLNRGTLLLMNQRDRDERRALCPDRMFKYVNKAVLACGDKLLHQQGCYTVSYQSKRQRLASMTEISGDLIDHYEQAVAHKFDPMSATPSLEELQESETRVVTHWLAVFCGSDKPAGSTSAYGALRNLLVNLNQDGVLKTLGNLRSAFLYPRNKLFVALPVLLSRSSDLRQIARLLGLSERAERSQIVERYLELWHRYS